jgi:hypothetical protein
MLGFLRVSEKLKDKHNMGCFREVEPFSTLSKSNSRFD